MCGAVDRFFHDPQRRVIYNILKSTIWIFSLKQLFWKRNFKEKCGTAASDFY